jgi:hypothetical protein
MDEWNEMELVMWGPIEGFIHLQDLQAFYKKYKYISLQTLWLWHVL